MVLHGCSKQFSCHTPKDMRWTDQLRHRHQLFGPGQKIWPTRRDTQEKTNSKSLSGIDLSIVANGTVGPTPGLNIKRATLPDNLFIVHSHPSQAGVCPIVAFHTALQAQPRADLSPRSAAD